MHTLTVDGDCDEMQTFFVICGAVLYIDDNDTVVHVEDNVGLIELCAEHVRGRRPRRRLRRSVHPLGAYPSEARSTK